MKKEINKDALLMSDMTPTEAGIYLYKNYIKDNKYIWSDLKDLGAAINRLTNFPENNLLITKAIVLSIKKDKFSLEDLIRKFPWLET